MEVMQINPVNPGSVSAALEDFLHGVEKLEELTRSIADKGKLVKSFTSRSLRADLQRQVSMLNTCMGTLMAALNLRSNVVAGQVQDAVQHMQQSVREVQKQLAAMKLEMLAKFERQSAEVRHAMDKSVAQGADLQHQQAAGSSLAYQLVGVLRATLPEAMSSVLHDKQALHAQLQQLQTEALEFKKIKEQQDALHLEQVIAALSLDTDTKAAGAAAPHAIPDAFKCKITGEVMRDPVITQLGHTYERSAISRWLETHGTEPATNEVLPSKLLVPNHDLKRAIAEWRAATPTRQLEPPAQLEEP